MAVKQQLESPDTDEFANEKFLMPVWSRSREDVKSFLSTVLDFLDDNCTDKPQSTLY